jgi:hypothetical protein
MDVKIFFANFQLFISLYHQWNACRNFLFIYFLFSREEKLK